MSTVCITYGIIQAKVYNDACKNLEVFRGKIKWAWS